MAGRALRVWLVALLTLLVAATGVGVYVLSIVLSDNLAFRQGSFAYAIVATSDTVRDFPRFVAAGQAVDFTYSPRDGTAPGEIVMTYTSEDAVDDLERKHRQHCERQGYEAVAEDGHLLPSRLACDAQDYRSEVDLQPRGSATSVTVVFLER